MNLERNLSVDSEPDHPIEKKIKAVQDIKIDLLMNIGTHFAELRKKVEKSIDKVEKFYQQKVHEVCLGTLDALRKVAVIDDLQSIDIFKYERKVQRVIAALRNIDLTDSLNDTTHKIKLFVQDLKKTKILEDVPQFDPDESFFCFEGKFKTEISEPVNKLVQINKKIMKISETTSSIDKYSLNKKIDLALSVKIPKKEKNVMFCLHDQTLAIYNDKLILHSHKPYTYNPEQLIGGTQLGKYIFIAERHKITRININNIGEIYVKAFRDSITTIGKSEYHEGVVVGVFIGESNQVLILSLDEFEPIFMHNCSSPVTQITAINQYLLILTEQGFEFFEKLAHVSTLYINGLNPLKIIPITDSQCVIVSRQSHFVYYNLGFKHHKYYATRQQQKAYRFLNSNIANKGIKDAALGGFRIYCLGESGRNVFQYSF